MSDLTERLRAIAGVARDHECDDEVFTLAADRIEALETALRDVIDAYEADTREPGTDPVPVVLACVAARRVLDGGASDEAISDQA